MARESRLAQRTLSKPQKPCADLRLRLGAPSLAWRLWKMRLSHSPVRQRECLFIKRPFCTCTKGDVSTTSQ